MGKSLAQLLREADNFVEKRASAKPVNTTPVSDEDDIFKLAEQIRNDGESSDATQEKEAGFELTPLEKVAHSLAIVETFLSAPELEKLTAFEKKAEDLGHSPEQVQPYLDKFASVNTAGSRTQRYFKGVGDAVDRIISGALPNLKGKTFPEGLGQISGSAIPAAIIAGAGYGFGRKTKSDELRRGY